VSEALERLLRRPDIWRGGRGTAVPVLPTGFAALDGALPGGGWPPGLTEILPARQGIGELRLLLPALVGLSRAGHWVVWVCPPHVPYAPALAAHGVDLARVLVVCPPREADGLWAAEQVLRARACGVALVWPRSVAGVALRRLQLAAQEGGSRGVLFREPVAALQPSPAGLRLLLEPVPGGTALRVLKCRGRAPAAPVVLALGPGAGGAPDPS
jgi:cell division inhibitor SulA/protein ImuA